MSESIYEWLLPINVPQGFHSQPLHLKILIFMDIYFCNFWQICHNFSPYEDSLILLSVKNKSTQNMPGIKSAKTCLFVNINFVIPVRR